MDWSFLLLVLSFLYIVKKAVNLILIAVHIISFDYCYVYSIEFLCELGCAPTTLDLVLHKLASWSFAPYGEVMFNSLVWDTLGRKILCVVTGHVFDKVKGQSSKTYHFQQTSLTSTTSLPIVLVSSLSMDFTVRYAAKGYSPYLLILCVFVWAGLSCRHWCSLSFFFFLVWACVKNILDGISRVENQMEEKSRLHGSDKNVEMWNMRFWQPTLVGMYIVQCSFLASF